MDENKSFSKQDSSSYSEFLALENSIQFDDEGQKYKDGP